MASRRSRLQIKPNIGGPKGPGAKPSPKPADPKSIKQENTGDTAAKLNNSPRKSISVGATSDKIEVDHIKIDGNKSKSSEKEVEIPQTNSNDSINGNDDVVKAGLRRFTKPSFVTTKSKTNRPVNEVKLTSDLSLKNENKDKDSGPENISDVNSTNNTVKKDVPSAVHLDKEQQENMAKSTPIPRRSRFPKAKPNVIDASKKRQRSISEQVCAPAVQSDLKNADEPKESPQKKELIEPTFPKEEMVIVNEDEVVCERSIHLDEGGLSEPPSSPQPFIPPKSPVKAPSGLTSITTSPVKQPHPRTRTISVSEAPVIKKPRRTKLDIPTDKPPDRSVMRMRDLIHWNPSSNPMKQKQKPENKQSVTTLDGEKENKKRGTVDVVDKQGDVAMELEEDDDSALPVPQVTIGPDGNIVINEKSLVVHDNSAEKGPSQEDDVIDETENTTTYASFRKRQLSKRWTKKETTRFYKALAMIGLDFFLIQKAFPSRTRTEIKKKFKREEKLNSRLVEKVLQEQIHFDERFLDGGKGDSSEEEEDVEPVKVKKEKKTKNNKGQQTTRKKTTKKSKEKGPSRFEYIDEPSDEEEDVADEPSTDKDDETWKPPNNREVAKQTGGRDSRQSNKRVVLTKEQVKGVVNAQEDMDMMYTAVPLLDMPVINKIGGSSGISTHQTFSVTPSEQSTSAVNRHDISSMEARTSGSAGIVDDSRPVQGGNFVNNGALENMHSQRTDRNADLIVHTVPQVCTSVVQGGVTGTASSVSDNMTIIMSPPMSGSQLTNIPEMTDSSDQYVLVTVRPDGSEETVIHIYKLPTSPRPVMSPPPINYQPQIMAPQVNHQQQIMFPPSVNNQPPVKSPPPMNCQPHVMSPVTQVKPQSEFISIPLEPSQPQTTFPPSVAPQPLVISPSLAPQLNNMSLPLEPSQPEVVSTPPALPLPSVVISP